MLLANEIFFAEIERMLGEGREVQFCVKGYSMRPLLRNGRDTVVLAPCDECELSCGDVVLFRYRGRHVLHRIVRIDGDRLTLEGDGNYRMQECCATSDVLGHVVRVVRPSGRAVACSSRCWRSMSCAWRLLPPIVRRYTLAVLFRLGCK